MSGAAEPNLRRTARRKSRESDLTVMSQSSTLARLRLVGALDLAAPEAVAHDAERLTGLAARSPATGATRRANRRAGRRYLRPKLDVDRGLDDACVASLDSLQSPSAERGGTTVGATTARHLFVRAPCPGVFSSVAPYDISRASGQKRARSARATGQLVLEYPSLSVRQIGSGSINYAAR